MLEGWWEEGDCEEEAQREGFINKIAVVWRRQCNFEATFVSVCGFGSWRWPPHRSEQATAKSDGGRGVS